MKELSQVIKNNKLNDEKIRKYQLALDEIMNNRQAFKLLQHSDTLTDEAKRKWQSMINKKIEKFESELRKDINSFDVMWSYIVDLEERIGKLEEQMNDLWRI